MLAGAEGAEWVEAARNVSSTAGHNVAAYRAGPQGDLVISKDCFECAAGVSSRGAILVRPDGFVAWRQRRLPSDPGAELQRAMRQVLGLR